MVTHGDTYEAIPHMRGMDNRDGAIRCFGRYELGPGAYRAFATTTIPVESDLLVFDRDANLFLACAGTSPAIEFELVRSQAVVVMGKFKGERPALAPDIHVRSEVQCSLTAAA